MLLYMALVTLYKIIVVLVFLLNMLVDILPDKYLSFSLGCLTCEEKDQALMGKDCSLLEYEASCSVFSLKSECCVLFRAATGDSHLHFLVIYLHSKLCTSALSCSLSLW